MARRPRRAPDRHRPSSNGAFRKIAIRKSRIAQVDVRDFSLLHWTDRFYFEVCADPAVYAALPGRSWPRRRSKNLGPVRRYVEKQSERLWFRRT